MDGIRYRLTEEGTSSPKFQKFVAVNTSGRTISTELWARTIADHGLESLSLTEAIQSCGYSAVFFETPAVRASTFSIQPFEFVLVDAPELYKAAHGQVDTTTFASHFNKETAASVFANHGGDAILISPNPRHMGDNKNSTSPNASFSHLASFAREAPHDIVLETWSMAAKAYLERVAAAKEQPIWFSTSGLGVNWLHFRLDDRPKYYTYAPYKKS